MEEEENEREKIEVRKNETICDAIYIFIPRCVSFLTWDVIK